jgi:hypothetical protein
VLAELNLHALWAAATGVSQKIPEVCDQFRAPTNIGSNRKRDIHDLPEIYIHCLPKMAVSM